MSERLDKLTERFTGQALVRAFDELMGGLGRAISWDGFYHWEDGSFRELNPLGPLCDAEDVIKFSSDGQHQVWHNMLFYANRKFEDSLKAFEKAKEELAKRNRYAKENGQIPPHPAELKHLRALKKEVVLWSKKYDAIEALMNPEPTPPDQEEIDFNNANRKAAIDFDRRLNNIEV